MGSLSQRVLPELNRGVADRGDSMHGWEGAAKRGSMGRVSSSGWRVSVFGKEREKVLTVLSGFALISGHRMNRHGLCGQAR